MKNALLLIIPVILLPAPRAWSRKIEEWPFEKLMQKADLVVIGTVFQTSRSKQSWSADIFSAERFEGQKTSVKITATLKGTSGKQIHVHHFVYRPGVHPYEDGPNLISFPTDFAALTTVMTRTSNTQDIPSQSVRKQTQDSWPVEYLMFLKKRPDGGYIPISGQVDPDLSIRTILPAQPAPRGE